MKTNRFLTLAAVLTLVLALAFEMQFSSPVLAQSTPAGPALADDEEAFDGWKVRNSGGNYSEDNGNIRLWTDIHDHGIGFYKTISPTDDFEFSLQVMANRIDGFGILIGTESFLKEGSKEGVQFEFHNKYGVNTFLLARFVHTVVWETGQPGDIWDWQGFAYGKENVWYTMKLTVQANPFKVSGEVFDENGKSMGAYSVSDMINLKFEDIECIGFGNGWGGDYSVRNISEVTDVSTEINHGDIMQTQISIDTDVSSTTLGTPLNIKGKLADSNGNALTNEMVMLSYSFQGLDGWAPISSTYTNSAGEYLIQWANTATGYFALKIQWSGNSAHLGCQNSTTVNILPYEDNKVFFVQSNSTITALSFNSTAVELAFSVTGPSETHGYTQVFLEKSLISNPEDFRVLLDDAQIDYVLTALDNEWLITIYYSHSTHEITMQFQNETENSMNQNPLLWIGLTVAVICIAVIAAIVTGKLRKPLPNQ